MFNCEDLSLDSSLDLSIYLPNNACLSTAYTHFLKVFADNPYYLDQQEHNLVVL